VSAIPGANVATAFAVTAPVNPAKTSAVARDAEGQLSTAQLSSSAESLRAQERLLTVVLHGAKHALTFGIGGFLRFLASHLVFVVIEIKGRCDLTNQNRGLPPAVKSGTEILDVTQKWG
jgi:hypothetical protein